MPISSGGVGNSMRKSNHGLFQVRLPLFSGSNAVFSGVCIDQITVEFLHYPLRRGVQDDVINIYKLQVIQVFGRNYHSLLVASCWASNIFGTIPKKFLVAIWTHHLHIMVQKCWWRKSRHWWPSQSSYRNWVKIQHRHTTFHIRSIQVI